MITLHGITVKVIGADLPRREATVRWEDGRVRLVSILQLRGTTGGTLEVVTVCREVERKQRVLEQAPSFYGTAGVGKTAVRPPALLDEQRGPE